MQGARNRKQKTPAVDGELIDEGVGSARNGFAGFAETLNGDLGHVATQFREAFEHTVKLAALQ